MQWGQACQHSARGGVGHPLCNRQGCDRDFAHPLCGSRAMCVGPELWMAQDSWGWRWTCDTARACKGGTDGEKDLRSGGTSSDRSRSHRAPALVDTDVTRLQTVALQLRGRRVWRQHHDTKATLFKCSPPDLTQFIFQPKHENVQATDPSHHRTASLSRATPFVTDTHSSLTAFVPHTATHSFRMIFTPTLQLPLPPNSTKIQSPDDM
jgi:hypothetical protein